MTCPNSACWGGHAPPATREGGDGSDAERHDDEGRYRLVHIDAPGVLIRLWQRKAAENMSSRTAEE